MACTNTTLHRVGLKYTPIPTIALEYTNSKSKSTQLVTVSLFELLNTKSSESLYSSIISRMIKEFPLFQTVSETQLVRLVKKVDQVQNDVRTVSENGRSMEQSGDTSLSGKGQRNDNDDVEDEEEEMECFSESESEEDSF